MEQTDIVQYNIDLKALNCTNDNHIVHQTHHFSEQEEVNGLVEEIVFDDISLVHGCLTLLKPFKYNYFRQLMPESIQMFFAFQGMSFIDLEDLPEQLSFECNQCNIFYSSEANSKIITTKQCSNSNPCKEWRFLEISIKVSFFDKYLEGNNVAFVRFKENLQNKQACIFCPNNLNISSEMHDILQQIVQHRQTGVHKRLFIEARILELISLQLTQIESYQCPALTRLKQTDIEKMYKAREILLCSKNSPCPLTELALKVGTNECTLKKGFKEVFGATVFGYLHDVKMKEAHHILLKGEQTIAEVAEQIGYKNATHFTTAFKKKYGIAPSRLKSSTVLG